MQISFQNNIKELTKNIDDQFKRQIPFATYLALQNTAKIVNNNIRTDIVKIFDRPTKQVIKSTMMVITPSRFSKTPLNEMAVKFEIDDSKGGRSLTIAESMEAEVIGGKRKYKRSETHLKSKNILRGGDMVVPGKEFLNNYGNLSGGKLVQIISGVAGFNEDTFRRPAKMNITKQSKSKNKNRSTYFVIRDRRGKMPAGIYERRGERIIPVLIFIKNTNYKVRWRFQDFVKTQFENNFNNSFEKSFAYAVKTEK